MNRLSVMVVEDDPISRKIVSSTVRKLGHDVIEVESGEAAMAYYAGHPDLDVILCGWVMDGMDGTELCRRIRETDDQHYTVFILLTSKSDYADKLYGIESGADAYLTKPSTLDEMRLRLLTASRTIKLHRRIERQAAELRRLNGQLFTEGRTDKLTGISNRLQFDEDLAAMHARAERNAATYVLVMADLDRFKPFNDTFGHQAGDDALRAVAQAMKSALRDQDHVYRYGGEEFCVLLDTDNLRVANQVVGRLQNAVRALRIPHVALHEPRIVTISAGIRRVEAYDDETPELALKAADEALYEAKEAGRDTAIIAKRIGAAGAI